MWSLLGDFMGHLCGRDTACYLRFAKHDFVTFFYFYLHSMAQKVTQTCQWENDAAVITAAAVSRPCQLCGSLGA